MKKARGISIYVSGFATALMLVIMAQSTFAASVMQQIYVNFDPVKIIIDGQEKTPPDDMKPMVYNGRTYVALRYVGEALGKEVVWEESSRTIRIGAPVAKALGHSETFTDGPLSSKWEKNGRFQCNFDGPNGMLASGYDELELIGILPDALCDYTVEFDSATKDGAFNVFLGKSSDNKYVDRVSLRIYSYSPEADIHYNGETIAQIGEFKKEEFNSYKLQVTNKQVDIYFNGNYITSQKLAGDKAGFAFTINNSSYYIKNFKLTVS